MTPWCEAYVPLSFRPDLAAVIPSGALVPCKAPAVAAYRYRCILGHQVTRSVCPEHDPVPGVVGCYECKQGGREEPMTWELVEVRPAPRQ